MKNTQINRLWCNIFLFSSCLLQGNLWNDEETRPFYTAIDYLFWRAEADQLQYALNLPEGFPNDGLFFAPQIIVSNQQFKGHSGVRAKMGYSICDDWDIAVAWTHFKNCTFSSTQGNTSNSIVAGSLVGLVQTDLASAANSSWFIKINQFDIEGGYTWCLCDALTLRPFIGIKGAFLTQAQGINYFALNGVPSSNAHIERNHKFISFGPRIGIEEQWHIVNNISVIGNLATSLLFGKFNLTNRFIISDGTRSTGPVTFDCRKELYPMMEMLLGLCWEKACEGYPLIQVAVAYELQYWWNQSQNLPSVGALISNATSVPGDLMTHGLTVRLGLRF